MVGGLLLSQALTLYTTPSDLHLLRQPRPKILAGRSREARAARHNRQNRHESFRTIYPAACGNDIADHRDRHRRSGCVYCAASFSSAPGRLPNHLRFWVLPGASAQIMASSVATPLERQFGHIAGVSEMTSASSLGSTSITIQFDLSRNIDGAARDVEAAISAARTYLPANLPANPTYRKVNPADAPIMILGLTSSKYDTGQTV
jgi:hypothetical protein